MTYLYFTLLYLGLPVVILGLTLPRSVGELSDKRSRTGLALTTPAALLYGAGLANYLSHRSVRGYEADRALHEFVFIPLEEYIYMGAASLLVGLLLVHVLARTMPSAKISGTAVRRIYIAVTLIYFVMMLSGAGLLLYGPDRVLYLAYLLVWAAPVLLLLWLYGGRHFLGTSRRALLISSGAATMYLWIAAWAGVSQYLWIISDRYTLSLRLSRFPLEEALLYLFLVLMITKALVLFFARDPQAAPARKQDRSFK